MNSHPYVRSRLLEVIPPEWWTAKDDATVLVDVRAQQGLVPNPVPQAMVPVHLKTPNIMSLVPSAVPHLHNNPNAKPIRDDIIAQDHAGVINWAYIWYAGGIITEAEKNAVMVYCATPVPDPAWQAELPWDVAEFGRALEVSDIAETRTDYEASLEVIP